MTPRIVIAALIVIGLAGCSTRLNPFNWFGNDREERITVSDEPVASDPLDQRALVAEVISLNVDPMPGGAIVRAMGLPPRQGFWEADLVEVSRAEGELVFEFRVFPPSGDTAVSTQQSREILAGTSLSQHDLAGIRAITVIALQNRRTVRRR